MDWTSLSGDLGVKCSNINSVTNLASPEEAEMKFSAYVKIEPTFACTFCSFSVFYFVSIFIGFSKYRFSVRLFQYNDPPLFHKWSRNVGSHQRKHD